MSPGLAGAAALLVVASAPFAGLAQPDGAAPAEPAPAASMPPGAPPASIPPASAPPASAVPAPDRVRGPEPPPAADQSVKLPWRDTWLIWDNSVTAQTLGIGKNYQSANPTYEMSGSFRPRYFFYDGKDDAFFAAGRIDLVHEFTNSDVTTQRGETTFSDATLLTAYRRTLATTPDKSYTTTLIARLPILTLPTSKFSLDNGTYLGLGTEVWLMQKLPLAGPKWPVFKSVILGGIAGYNHTFTRAVTPTNEELRRVRLDPLGRTVPGDQLVGAAFPEHELLFTGRVIADITDKVSLWLEASYRPTWKYGFSDVDVRTQTGDANASHIANPNRYVPTTAFEADVYYDVIDQLTLGIGYVNVETQPGLDGQRRTIFYSPGAQFHLELIAHLDNIYLAATGQKAESSSGTHLRP